MSKFYVPKLPQSYCLVVGAMALGMSFGVHGFVRVGLGGSSWLWLPKLLDDWKLSLLSQSELLTTLHFKTWGFKN